MKAFINNNYYQDRYEYNRRRRVIAKRRSLIKRRLVMLILFIAITISAVFSIRFFTYANNNNDQSVKKYRSELIYCKDSLDSFADKHLEYGYTSRSRFIKEICSINSISTNTVLIAGNHIILPYFED